MKLRRDPVLFQPITIRLENQDELDRLLAIIENVARNRITHTDQVMCAAKEMLKELNRLLGQEDE